MWLEPTTPWLLLVCLLCPLGGTGPRSPALAAQAAMTDTLGEQLAEGRGT